MAKVLVIDDHPSIRNSLTRVLSALGHQVTCLPDGSKVEGVLKEFHPDAVITDIWMPNRDGLETIRLIRETFPEIVVIAMSGRPAFKQMDVLAIAEKMGAVATLRKPFAPETDQELRRILAEL